MHYQHTITSSFFFFKENMKALQLWLRHENVEPQRWLHHENVESQRWLRHENVESQSWVSHTKM